MTLTIAEIRRGILEKPEGKRRNALDVLGLQVPKDQALSRIPPFDEQAALVWARLTAEGKAAGWSRKELDMTMASVASANDCMSPPMRGTLWD